MYDDLKRNLENVIKKESEKAFHPTGKIRIDWMAQECLTAIADLSTQLAEAKADYEAAVEDIEQYTACQLCKNTRCYKRNGRENCKFEYRGRNKGNG